MARLGFPDKARMICAPLMAQSVEQMLNDMHQAKMEGADVVEIRLDCIHNFEPWRDLKLLLENKPIPVVVVCRGQGMRYKSKCTKDFQEITPQQPSWEGGQYKGDEQEQLQALLLAKDLGADYIDLEFKVASALIKEDKLSQLKSSKIIVSCYLDSLATLKEDLNHLVAEMQSTKADIIKFVSSVANITEIADVFDLLSNSQTYSGTNGTSKRGNMKPELVAKSNYTFIWKELKYGLSHIAEKPADYMCTFDVIQYEAPIIAYCTGERGLISQLLSFKFGGVFIYGSIEEYAIPGLPSINSLRQAYGVKNIDKNTQVFGLISKPVSHSKGPILHNPTFRHVGYNGVYVPMLVDNLKEFFDVYSNPDFAGFSVGIPYKEAVIDFCDEVHPLAQSIGAVNTIIRRSNDGKLVGYNTDCEAAISAIEDALKGCTNCEGLHSSPLNGKLFVLVGAGGAGRALAFGAKIRGARIVVFDIDFDRAKSLAAAVSGEALPFENVLSFRPEKDAILANGTPLGMHPNVDRIPVPEETLKDYKLVFDAVYNPRKTRLLKEAEAAGAIVVSGVEMFLRQAAAQFSLFTTQKAPEEFMRGIILERF